MTVTVPNQFPIIVPNQFPSKPSTRRLAICGESPGTSETTWHTCNACAYEFETEWWERGRRVTTDKCQRCYTRDIRSTPKPFVGKSGRLLNLLLAEVGIERECCYLGNCAQVQPPRNEIALFKWDGPELAAGLEVLRAELAAWQPHMLLLLGNTPLRHLTGDRKRNIGDWRGSLITVGGVKAMATYHPAALLREAHLTGVDRFDFKRLAEELRVDGLELPKRTVFILHPDVAFDFCTELP